MRRRRKARLVSPVDIDHVNQAEKLLNGLQYLPDFGPRVLAIARALAAEQAIARAALAITLDERNEAQAKLEKVATVIADLDLIPGARMIAQILDNILFPCECPGEHCGECGCCPDEWGQR